MLPAQRDAVVVVLVRARNPSNIGAVARAMHDFGFRHLRVVNEYPVPFAAAKSAVDASSVLQAATEPTTLAAAVADCTLVIGTTAVGERVLHHPLLEPAEAAGRIAQELAHGPGRVALVFGSEKTGLSNDELSCCHALLSIPMNPVEGGHLSMNLGQAAAVSLWAISQPAQPPAAPFTQPPAQPATRATAGDLERLTGMLRECMDRSGYTRRHPANSREPVVRRLLHRLLLSADDAVMGTGLLRQLLHALPEANVSRDA